MKKVFTILCYARTVAAALMILYSPGLASASAEEWNAYVAVERFEWKEFKDDGSLFLKESGPLFGLGFTYRKEFPGHVTVEPGLEIFGGSVDYDGQTLSGIPAATTVDYFGVKVKGEVGRRSNPMENVFLDPFVGLGIRYWFRDIDNGVAADGSPVAGYVEEWFTLQARFGLRGEKYISSRTRIFGLAGVLFPVYNRTTAYLSDVGYSNDSTVEPGRKESFFAEAGFRVNTVTMSLFYEGMRFTKSNFDTATHLSSGVTLPFYQPESDADSYGVKLGIIF
jgi:hypothetical protein